MQNLDISTIIFAIVAIFVVVKLRSVLGTRNGAERPPQNRAPSSRAPGDFRAPAGRRQRHPARRRRARRRAPRRGGALARPLEGLRASPARRSRPGSTRSPPPTPILRPTASSAGARGAYEMIVSRFRGCGHRNVAPTAGAGRVRQFRQGDSRPARRRPDDDDDAGVDRPRRHRRRAADRLARLGRRALRRQDRLGDARRRRRRSSTELANEVADHLDVWTFTRDADSRDPNWLLAATQTVH